MRHSISKSIRGLKRKDSEVNLKTVSFQSLQTSAVMTGYLTKKGFKNAKSWKRRLFVLTDSDYLYYFKSDRDKSALGVIHLEGCCVSSADDDPDCGHDFSLKIDTPGRIYYMYADSEDDIEDWIYHLREASGKSLVVKQSGFTNSNSECRSIGEALGRATPGEQILVFPGIYEESIVIDKPGIRLVGVDPSVFNQDQDHDDESSSIISPRGGSRAGSVMTSPRSHSLSKSSMKAIQNEISNSPSENLISSPLSSNNNNNTNDNNNESDIHNNNNNVQHYQQTGGKVIIKSEGTNKSAVWFQAENGIIENISIRQTTTPQVCAVVVAEGSLEMNHCTVSCPSASGILVLNTAEIHLHTVTVQDVLHVGAWFWDNSRGHLQGCEFKSCGWDGIRVAGEANVDLSECMIGPDIGQHGLCYEDMATGKMDNSDVRNCGWDGVRISVASIVVVKNSKLQLCETAGIHIMGSETESIVEDNFFLQNGRENIMIEDDVQQENLMIGNSTETPTKRQIEEEKERKKKQQEQEQEAKEKEQQTQQQTQQPTVTVRF